MSHCSRNRPSSTTYAIEVKHISKLIVIILACRWHWCYVICGTGRYPCGEQTTGNHHTNQFQDSAPQVKDCSVDRRFRFDWLMGLTLRVVTIRYVHPFSSGRRPDNSTASNNPKWRWHTRDDYRRGYWVHSNCREGGEYSPSVVSEVRLFAGYFSHFSASWLCT